jgi:methylated-DNA-[protein]-cysteine S-methyltransferase
MISFEHGSVALVASADLINRVCFECSPDMVMDVIGCSYPNAVRESQPTLQHGLRQLNEYFRGTRQTFTLKFDNSTLTDFAKNVQLELLKVPYGTLITYGELATRAGVPGAARAVGRAMATNPFPLLVPCHRVVHADGTIGQYSAAYGAASKSWLITMERDIAGREQTRPLR